MYNRGQQSVYRLEKPRVTSDHNAQEPVDECSRIINTLKSPIVRHTSGYKNPCLPKNQRPFPKAGFKTKIEKQKQKSSLLIQYT